MSKLDQLAQRPATLIISSRVDARHLATLALWWRDKGERITSISELVRLSIETLAEFITEMDSTTMIPTQAIALEFLTEVGLKTKTHTKALLEALMAEGKSPETFFSKVDPVVKTKAESQLHTLLQEGSPTFKEVLTHLNGALNEDLESRATLAKERTEEMLKGMNLVPEDFTD